MENPHLPILSSAHSLAREGVAKGVVEVQTDEAQKALTKP